MVGTIRLLSVHTGLALPLMAGGRRVLSDIGKRPYLKAAAAPGTG